MPGSYGPTTPTPRFICIVGYYRSLAEPAYSSAEVISDVEARSARGRPAALVLAFWILLTLVACSSGMAAPGSGGERAGVPGYRVLRDVELPGDTSRWDYTAYDAAARRLYLAHLGASEVVAFDTERQRVAGVVHDVAGVHGLVVAPSWAGSTPPPPAGTRSTSSTPPAFAS